MKTAFIDLGIIIGRLIAAPLDKKTYTDRLDFVSLSRFSDGGSYFPAESLGIYSTSNILKLRDFLNEHYPPELKND